MALNAPCDVTPGSPSLPQVPADDSSSAAGARAGPVPCPPPEELPLLFAREAVAQAWAEATPLMFANHDETGALDRSFFQPDQARYLALEAAGKLVVFTMRRGGRLVGYSAMLLSDHLDYPGVLWGMQLALYVVPAERSLKVLGFLRWQDEQLRDARVRYSYRHSTMAHPYGKLLSRLGYKPQELRYVRELPQLPDGGTC